MTEQARTILAHLLSKIKEKDSKYYGRYAEWLNAQEGFETFLFRCVRAEVWRCLQTGCEYVDACKAVGGDIRFEGRGIYMDGILGVDKRFVVILYPSGSRIYPALTIKNLPLNLSLR